jgi:hypothetical protein
MDTRVVATSGLRLKQLSSGLLGAQETPGHMLVVWHFMRQDNGRTRSPLDTRWHSHSAPGYARPTDGDNRSARDSGDLWHREGYIMRPSLLLLQSTDHGLSLFSSSTTRSRAATWKCRLWMPRGGRKAATPDTSPSSTNTGPGLAISLGPPLLLHMGRALINPRSPGQAGKRHAEFAFI